jgi:putative endonuclease
MAYYVYVLLCSNGSYYTGYARNVMSRFRQHERGLGARYTRINKPEKVVHIEKFHTRREAMRREKTIKRLSHTQKKKLASIREA